MEPITSSDQTGPLAIKPSKIWDPCFGYYVTTCQPSSSVKVSLKGAFCSTEPLDLIIGMSDQIVIKRLTKTGLEPRLTVKINGTLATLILFRPDGHNKDLLFGLTERHHYFILEFDISTQTILTKSSGDFSTDPGLPLERGVMACLDPNNRCLVLFLTQGMVKLIPLVTPGQINQDNATLSRKAIPSGREFEVGDVISPRDHLFHSLNPLDCIFLHGQSDPTLAVLCAEAGSGRSLCTYSYNPISRELVKAEFEIKNFGKDVTKIIALSDGGVMGLGDNGIVYASPNQNVLLDSDLNQICCVSPVDHTNRLFLVGDRLGQMHLLSLEYDNHNRFASFQVQPMGVTSVPTTMTYLDNYHVYIGSHYGDNQLVKIDLTSKDEPSLQVVERDWSMSPIIDAVTADLLNDGTQQLVTCSGGYQHGRLHVLRNGARFKYHGNVPLRGAIQIFPLVDTDSNPTMLCVVFPNQTKLLGLDENEELMELEVNGFDHDRPTLAISRMASSWVVQVTENRLKVVDLGLGKKIAEWVPDAGENITLASVSDNRVVLALGSTLRFFQIDSDKILEVSHITLDETIACLTLDTTLSGDHQIGYVGLWSSFEIISLNLNTMTRLDTLDLNLAIPPQQLFVYQPNPETKYLLISSTDGKVYYPVITEHHQFLNPTFINPSTQPTKLVQLNSELILAISAQSFLVTASQYGLKSTYINAMPSSLDGCIFKLGDSTLCTLTSDGLELGWVDIPDQLFVKTIHLTRSPKCVSAIKANGTVAVLTAQSAALESYVDTTDLVLYDIEGFKHTYSFAKGHVGLSLTWMQLPHGLSYIVGTGDIDPSKPISSSGYIHVVEVDSNKKLRIYQSIHVTGAVHSVKALGDKLVASVNGKICRFTPNSDGDLEMDGEHFGSMFVVDLKTHPATGQILVGDLMRSIHLVQSQPESLVETYREFKGRWVMAVEFLTDNKILLADSDSNLILFRKPKVKEEKDIKEEGEQEEEGSELIPIGYYHVGDQINGIVRGHYKPLPLTHASDPDTKLLSTKINISALNHSAPSHQPEDIVYDPFLIFTISGSVKVMNPIPRDTFKLLWQLQINLGYVLGDVGNLKLRTYRSYHTRHFTLPPSSFLDGDLIQTYSTLPIHIQRLVLEAHPKIVIPASFKSQQAYPMPPHQPPKPNHYEPFPPPKFATKEDIDPLRKMLDEEGARPDNEPYPLNISHEALMGLLSDLDRLK